jgi:hypothetical protein
MIGVERLLLLKLITATIGLGLLGLRIAPVRNRRLCAGAMKPRKGIAKSLLPAETAVALWRLQQTASNPQWEAAWMRPRTERSPAAGNGIIRAARLGAHFAISGTRTLYSGWIESNVNRVASSPIPSATVAAVRPKANA